MRGGMPLALALVWMSLSGCEEQKQDNKKVGQSRSTPHTTSLESKPSLDAQLKDCKEYASVDAYEAVIRACSVIIDINADNPKLIDEARYRRAIVYSDANKFDKALGDLSKLIDEGKGSGTVYSRRGALFRDMRKPELAIVDFSKAIELDPSSPDYYVGRAYARIAKHDLEAAITDYSKSLDLERRPWTFLGRSRAYRAHGEYEKADADYQIAIEAYSRKIETETQERVEQKKGYINNSLPDRARAYAGAGEFGKAVLDWSQSVKMQPSTVWHFYGRADTFLEAENWITRLQICFAQ